MKFFPSVRIALIVLFTILSVGMTVQFLLLARSVSRHAAVEVSGSSPKEAAATAQALLAERFENLAAKSIAAAESLPLKTALAPAQPVGAQVTDATRELMPALNASFLVVLGRTGAVLFDSRLDGSPKEPSSLPWAAPALQGASERSYFSENGLLFQAVAVPVSSPGNPSGAVVVGSSLDESFLKRLKDLTGNEAVLLSGSLWIAATSPDWKAPVVGKELAPILPGGTQAVAAAPHIQSLSVAKKDYEASYLVLPGAKTEASGSLVFLKPVVTASVLPSWPFLAAGALWLVLAWIFALAVSRTVSRPLQRLKGLIEQAENGDLKETVELPVGHEAEPLAQTLHRFLRDQQQRDLMRNILGKHAPQSTVRKLLESGEPPALLGERRECVILFCGIRGFSSFAENADPSKLAKGLSDYFTLMSNIIFKYDGLVDKFVGDTFMALWGAPLAQDDAEMKAVRAALEIQETLKEFNSDRVKQNLHPMMVGIGIVKGDVVAGNLGSEQVPDYTVIGDEVSLAAKLAQKASAGQVVVSDAAFQKIKDRVEINPLAPIISKAIAARGFAEPVKIHVVTGLKT